MRKAFTQAYILMRRSLLRRASVMLGSDDDAADIMQEVFCRLWRRSSSLQEPMDGDEIGRLASTSIRNACIDNRRSQTLHPRVPLGEADGAAYEGTCDTSPLFAEVEEIIARSLSPRERDILYRRDFDGCDYDCIAADLGLSEANVRMILSRARRKVRDIYHERHQSR